jgi:PAS domain S-box-containing protein
MYLKNFQLVGSWDLDPKTGRVAYSEDMCRITGLEPVDIKSTDAFLTNTIHPDDRQYVIKALQAALHGNESCNINYRAIVSGGDQRTLHIEGEVKYQEENQLFNVTGVLRDVTRQTNLEALHLENSEIGFNIVDIDPNPVLIIDDDTRVQYANEAFEKVTGYLAKDILGITTPYPWWPADLHGKYTGELLRAINGSTKKGECLYKKKSGRNVWVEVTTRTLKINGNAGYHFIYLSDLTKAKRLEENMQFYLSEVTRAQEEERRRIACEIHDEILQSLASLALVVDALGKDKSRSAENLQTLLPHLRNGIQEMAQRLRQFSHELRPSIIDQGLIPALEYLAQENSRGTNVYIRFSVQGTEQRLPTETEIGLFRITQEAVRNIVKHSGATEAIIRLRYMSDSVKLVISDNGIGFELPDELKDLASRRRLGIIGMQERSYLLNGKFTIRSRVGRGTTVMTELKGIKYQ